jgi:hypothetical protein
MHDPNVLQILPSHSPIVAHPILLTSPLRGLSSPAVPSRYVVPSCAALHCGGKVLDICALLVKHDRQGDNRLLQIGVPLLVGTEIRQNVSDSFGHNSGFAASSYAGNSLDVVKVPLSFPLVQPNGSTMDNHKILLQFNLHKLYNLCKLFLPLFD